MNDMGGKSLYAQAVDSAALMVAEAWEARGGTDSAEDLARELIRKHDPLQCEGVNDSGAEISFTWSFGYADVPAIASRAQALGAEGS
jgi:hypothetical protein